jgi:ComF family protein
MKGLSNQTVKRWRAVGVKALVRCWPQDCFVCGARAGTTAVCTVCEPELPWYDTVCCPLCALPVPELGQWCGQCLRLPPHFDATLAAFAYEHPVREMVLALKFGSIFSVRDVLLKGLLRAAANAGDLHVDCIVPMPLHARRIAERGFNQSMELARGVGAALGVPVLPRLVERDIDTRHQAGMPVRQRKKNVRGAFRCVESLAGRHVLVIDDVMTSGTTLDELARTLKLAGAARVVNLLVARTLRSK